ncbi:ATP nucleotide 3'-pyrophosphokinase [Streptomyces scopuliridis]|uniref:ATP nucleotide 3'-pyrophosphokinase n=1 Tax=Streptomyces scopuliridis TaxID=452529 RepID=A0ACD4ZEZ6_9ACTN|nr:ATP nucleotide 3'-pyrophosphokinase [Streptomyces scopuliridis]WSB96739.1 ATP nucleotide 3'-pyrophosphokinase [Streptomyces scopuliridis]WSC09558.1 ATP nucleotide 3'-pyrophosphokinase [Streptomyces scopuliridis]
MTMMRRAAAAALGTALAATLNLTAAHAVTTTAGGTAVKNAPLAAPVPAPAPAPELDEGWRGDGLSLSPAENNAVEEFLGKARRTEAVISPRLRNIARLSNAELAGFDQRLKSPDSLKRKVATSLVDHPGQNIDQALAGIGDSLRYTFQWPTDRYTDGVTLAATFVSAWQGPAVRWKNTWGGKTGYKGINTNWDESSSQHRFEIQFHTPESRDAAVSTHRLYEEQRLPGTSPERARELQRQMDEIFGAVPVPAGAAQLAAP